MAIDCTWRDGLQCVLADVAAVAGQDAEVLRRDAPPAADGAAEGGKGRVAAALHHLRERQLGVAQQVARHLHVPVQAQLGEGQAGELMDGGRELRVRVASIAWVLFGSGALYQAVHDHVEHPDARQLPRLLYRHHPVGQTPFVKTPPLGEGGHV